MFPYYSIYMTTLLFGHPQAYALIQGISTYHLLQGMVLFFDTGRGTIVTADFKGLPISTQKEHVCNSEVLGFHIHEGTSCDTKNHLEDLLANTGMHLNPDRCPHPYHMGDMPPLFSNNGTAWMAFYTERFRIWDVIGKTVVVHSKRDDFTSQPSGDSGEKIACGVIKRELH